MIINRFSNDVRAPDRPLNAQARPRNRTSARNRSSFARDKRSKTRFVSQNKSDPKVIKSRSARWKFQYNDVCTIPPRENAKRFRENSIEPLRYSVTAILVARLLPNREERYSLERRSIDRTISFFDDFRFFNFSTFYRDRNRERKKFSRDFLGGIKYEL